MSVFGTAWYQLNHATIRVNVKRPHVVTWFGVCSYRKLKVTVERMKSVCPLCKHELVELRYMGKKLDKWLVFCSGSFFADYEEDGFLAWAEVVRNSYG